MRAAAFALALAAVAFAGPPGIRPRGSSTDYRSQETRNGTTVAAQIVPADQVRSTFSTELTRDYVVVEVAVYPPPDGVNVGPADFLLRCGTEMIRPGNPNAIATRKQQKNAPRNSDIDIYPSVGVGYETGNNGPYGRSRGVYTTTGVAVATGGAGNPRPASTDQDRRTMALELEEQQLPNGLATKPVAGYLYFPFPSSKQKHVAYELDYDGAAGRMRLFLK